MDLLFQEMKQYPLHFLDLGCSGALDQKWAELFPFLFYNGFDPNTEECRRLASQPHPFKEARYLPYAIHKDKGTYVMVKTESIYCYSLLRPNHPWLNRFSFSDLFSETGTEPVVCTTLDHLAREEGLKADIMKLDTQGLELPILQSGNEVLKNAICVETETGFMENYIGETTYAQIDEFMRSKGFLMFDLSIHRVGRKNFLSEHGMHQPIWCEALWLFDFIGQEREPNREQAVKALILCRALKCYDYGFELASYFKELGFLKPEELAHLSRVESWEVRNQ
jgi:FkbM family methyltransferase